MSKRLFFIIPVLVFSAIFGCYTRKENSAALRIQALREKHADFLRQGGSLSTANLSRKERMRKGLPPNRYYEEMELFSMNPVLGFSEPYKKEKLHEKLLKRRQKKSYSKAPGESDQQPWISQGPDNVGGRTRVLLFDPEDPEAKRVFAGAISGGLWVNEDITDKNSPWKQVPGLPGNANISSLSVDPQNEQVWYAGTGEQYTSGNVLGSGVYKTSDGGASWKKVLDVKDFANSQAGEDATVVGGLYYINDIMAWHNGENTEIFVAVSSHVYDQANNPTNFLGYYDRGLYNSKDGGETWTKVISGESFNDFETDAAGHLWAATTAGYCDLRGGKIYRRKKGFDTSLELVHSIPDVARTEIEASATDPDKFYVLAEKIIAQCSGKNEADLWITTDAFAHLSRLHEPDDADDNIPPENFARDLSFYALMIESDPEDDNIIYVGSINLFRSVNSGQTWKQISKMNNNGPLADLPVSLVHADHHAMQFRPGKPNEAVFGHDGGVSYASDLSAASSSKTISAREKGYVTSQFYSVAVAPLSFRSGDYFLGGTQDNGSQVLTGGGKATEVLGGDGAYTFFDQVNTDYYITNYVYNDVIVAYDFSQNKFAAIANNSGKSGSGEGFFINPQALDSRLNLLFSNGPNGTLYRYDNLDDLQPLVENVLNDDAPVADRTEFRHPLLETHPSEVASITAIKVSPFKTSGSTVLLGLINGKLLKLEKAHGDPEGAEWTEITGSGFVGSISDIEFGRSENEVLVTFYNYGVKNIWYSSNAMSEDPDWTSKEGDFPDLPVLSILQNPSNEKEVIIGTELGTWKSADFDKRNPTWVQSYNGMRDVKVTDLDLKKGTSVVFAATYGRGIFSGSFSNTENPEGPEVSQPLVTVYPTASGGNYNLVSRRNLGLAEVAVFSLDGRLVQFREIELQANFPKTIVLDSEASGLYFVRVKSTGFEQVQKIIKK